MDNDWVLSEIEKIALFGKEQNGVTRLAFSEADFAAKEYVIQLMKDCGLEVKLDSIGNIIGKLEGKDKDAPVVITGSHLDTVPNAGKYDGVVGIVGGLAAVKKLKDLHCTHPLELIIFAAEESSRFGVATIGSKCMTGAVNNKGLERLVDQDGIRLTGILEKHGLSGEFATVRQQHNIKAFIELHIEQSSVLERTGNRIGIVESIAAPARCKITVEGVASHSGTTPMEERQDALVSAAMIVLAINDIALEQSDNGIVGTVGALKVHPGAINVVPGTVEMWVDIRGLDHFSIVECMQAIKDEISNIAERQNTVVSIEMISFEHPVHLDKQIAKIIDDICQSKKIPFQRLYSRAGHDAMNLSRITPTGLIFIPCKNGLSHNPEEHVLSEDIFTGIDVLTETLYRLAR